MLTTHRLAKHYELTTLFTEVSFTVNPGERVALIGPNGSGKSTLLRLLAGVEAPDAGAVTYLPADLRIGYLPQGIAAPGSPLHNAQTVGAVLTHLMGDLPRLEAELTEIAEQLAFHPNQTDLQTRYDAVLQQLATAPDPTSVQRTLNELGLLTVDPALPLSALSGGQQTRMLLAKVLLSQPQLLLLDEPTNHLDVDTLAWLEDWLANFSGAVLLVSHDRAFLDNTVTRVLDLDPSTQTLRAYVGNYSDYVEQVVAEREQQWDAYRHQQTEIRRMHTDIVNTRNQALHVERTTKPNQPTVRRLAKKVARKAKSRERKLDRYIASDERVEKPKAGWQIKVDFASPESSRQAVVLEHLAVGFDPSAPLLHGLSQVLYAGDRVALIGPNGSGKTTLLRTLIGELPPLAGSLRTGPSVQLGYLSQAQTQFAPETTPVQAIQQVVPWRETETRNFLHYYLFSGDEALKPVVQLSFGQRTRLELARLVATGCNCLLLDEPINHLDIPSRSLFEQALARFEGAVLVVTHDRYFVQRFATRLWQVHGQTLVES